MCFSLGRLIIQIFSFQHFFKSFSEEGPFGSEPHWPFWPGSAATCCHAAANVPLRDPGSDRRQAGGGGRSLMRKQVCCWRDDVIPGWVTCRTAAGSRRRCWRRKEAQQEEQSIWEVSRRSGGLKGTGCCFLPASGGECVGDYSRDGASESGPGPGSSHMFNLQKNRAYFSLLEVLIEVWFILWTFKLKFPIKSVKYEKICSSNWVFSLEPDWIRELLSFSCF